MREEKWKQKLQLIVMISMSIHWVCLSIADGSLLLWPRTFSFCVQFPIFTSQLFAFFFNSSFSFFSSALHHLFYVHLLRLQRVIVFFRFVFEERERESALVCRTFFPVVREAFVMNHSVILSNRKCRTITMFSLSFCLSKKKEKYKMCMFLFVVCRIRF